MTLAEGYLLIMLLRPDLPVSFFRDEVILMEQPPFDVELIALGHMRPDGINSEKKYERITVAYPKNVILEPPLLRFFFSKNTPSDAQ